MGSKSCQVSTELDMIQLSIFSHRFMSIAEQMGGILQVWSLTSFKVSSQLLTNALDQVSSVSLLMTALTALAKNRLLEPSRCHSWKLPRNQDVAR